MKILVAEDDTDSRLLLERLLTRWGYEVVSCHDGLAAWRALGKPGAPRLAILDWMMPGMDGPEICRRLRRRTWDHYVYVLLLTAKGGAEDIVGGLDAGADDYLAKPFDPHELRARLRTGRRIIELQADLTAAREALRYHATRDALTGLWNRAAILEILDRESTRAAREGAPLAVLIADVDHFKAVNDTSGHAAGDDVLREVATRLVRSVRPYDSVGRYGGEEFLFVLPHCEPSEAAGVAERVRCAVSGEPIGIPQGTVSVTVSLGVAASRGIGDTDATVRAADAALYRAKDAGRDRVEHAPESTTAAEAPEPCHAAPRQRPARTSG